MCDDDHSPWRGCKRLYDETETNGGAQMLVEDFWIETVRIHFGSSRF